MSAADDERAGALALLDDQALLAHVQRLREKLVGQLDALERSSPWIGQLAVLDDATFIRIRRELGEEPGEGE